MFQTNVLHCNKKPNSLQHTSFQWNSFSGFIVHLHFMKLWLTVVPNWMIIVLAADWARCVESLWKSRFKQREPNRSASPPRGSGRWQPTPERQRNRSFSGSQFVLQTASVSTGFFPVLKNSTCLHGNAITTVYTALWFCLHLCGRYYSHCFTKLLDFL